MVRRTLLALVLAVVPALSSAAETLHLFVKTPAGKTIELDAAPSDTVGALKKRVEKDVPPPDGMEYRVVFAGKDLDDARTLESYSIGNESTLRVWPRFPAAKP
jgi:hypothetical protein